MTASEIETNFWYAGKSGKNTDAARDAGVPHAYLLFEGEQHGFRRAENIERALEAELAFYGEMLGFDPADQIEPVPIAGR
jgi:hypothetical protein